MIGMRMTALAVAGTVFAGVLMAPAQAQQRTTSPDSPADVKALLFDLANSMGMLRSLQQEDSIITLEHWAKGTATIGQQQSEVTTYRLSLNYSVPGMRVDMSRKLPNGQTERQIEVVSGTAAWNETERGLNPRAALDKSKERVVYMWTTPMGVVKAARLAGAKASVKTQNGTTVLSFPLPAPAADVIVNATIRRDASLAVPDPAALKDLVGTYIVRVDTTGGVTSQTTYAEYGDWNWDDYQADVMLPKRIVRTSGGATLELTTVNTNTYNPYVIMPVPESMAGPGGSR